MSANCGLLVHDSCSKASRRCALWILRTHERMRRSFFTTRYRPLTAMALLTASRTFILSPPISSSNTNLQAVHEQAAHQTFLHYCLTSAAGISLLHTCFRLQHFNTAKTSTVHHYRPRLFIFRHSNGGSANLARVQGVLQSSLAWPSQHL